MSSLRLSGIASGIDTESMIKELMKAERIRVDRLTQNKQTALWKQELYNDLNKEFANFVLDTAKEFGVSTGNVGSMIRNASNLTWVKKVVSSNDNILTATATSNAAKGTHQIKVKQLAEGVSVGSASTVKKTDESQATSTTKLSDLGITDGSVAFVVKTNGAEENVTVNFTGDQTISDFVRSINNAVRSDGKTSLGLQASFDSGSGRLFLSTKSTGGNEQIKIASDGDEKELFTGAKIFNIDLTTAKEGKDAIIDFDGAENIKYASNQFTINGVQINLKSLSADSENDKFTLTVDTDVDSVYNKISAFVDKYNALIEKLNGFVAEKQYRDYKPLTAEQKEAMSEKDIKLWEEKAKSGLLRNDDAIGRVLTSMRSGLYQSVSGLSAEFNQLTDIGITTDEWKSKGKLKINEDKLKEAIQKDADKVLELFFKPSSITKSDADLTAVEKRQKREESGLINRLFDDVVSGMKEIVNKSGTGGNEELYRSVKTTILIDFVTKMSSTSYLDKSIQDLENSIVNEESRLTKKEDSYWSKFTAMEKAMQKMNSQSSWIAQQLGGMSQ